MRNGIISKIRLGDGMWIHLNGPSHSALSSECRVLMLIATEFVGGLPRWCLVTPVPSCRFSARLSKDISTMYEKYITRFFFTLDINLSKVKF